MQGFLLLTRSPAYHQLDSRVSYLLHTGATVQCKILVSLSLTGVADSCCLFRSCVPVVTGLCYRCMLLSCVGRFVPIVTDGMHDMSCSSDVAILVEPLPHSTMCSCSFNVSYGSNQDFVARLLGKGLMLEGHAENIFT